MNTWEWQSLFYFTSESTHRAKKHAQWARVFFRNLFEFIIHTIHIYYKRHIYTWVIYFKSYGLNSTYLSKGSKHILQIIIVNKPISILIDHVKGLFKFLDLILIKHCKYVGGCTLSTFLRARPPLGFPARHFGGWLGREGIKAY